MMETTNTVHKTATPADPAGAGAVEMRLDDVLELIPVGKYHYRLLIICGMSFMSDAMVSAPRCVISCMPTLMPPPSCRR